MGSTEIVDRVFVSQAFEYMSMGNLKAESRRLRPKSGALVFCREDPGIAKATAVLFRRGLINWAVLTGGVGKDSGTLTIPEAVHQRNLLVKAGVGKRFLYAEPTAHNGAENSRFGIDAMRLKGLPCNNLLLVMHPHSARRAFAVHTRIAREEKGILYPNYIVVCMETILNVDDPNTCMELARELLRVVDWPAKGWSDQQSNPPNELIAWARSKVSS